MTALASKYRVLPVRMPSVISSSMPMTVERIECNYPILRSRSLDEPKEAESHGNAQHDLSGKDGSSEHRGAHSKISLSGCS